MALAQSISQSAALTALFTKESRLCGLFGLLICSGRLLLTTLLSAEPTPSLAQGEQACSLFGLLFYKGKTV